MSGHGTGRAERDHRGHADGRHAEDGYDRGADRIGAQGGEWRPDDPTQSAKGRVERRLANSSLRGVTVAAKRVVEGLRRRLPRKMPPVKYRF